MEENGKAWWRKVVSGIWMIEKKMIEKMVEDGSKKWILEKKRENVR